MQKINTNFAELYGTTAEANDLIEDGSPQLGGNLDINGFNITSSRSNENIRIVPNGTGDLVVTSDIVPDGDNTQELGSNSKRWKEIHIGPGSLSFWDIVLNTRTQIEKAQADLLKAIDNTGFSGSTASSTKAIIDTGFNANIAGRLKQADDAGFIVITDGSTTAIGITNARSNGDVAIVPNGTGTIIIDELKIDSTELTPINNNSSIVLTPTGTGTVKFNSGFGFNTGQGGTQSQSTSKSTTVTLNKPTGQITTDAATLNAGSSVSFTFSNSLIESTDHIIITHISGGTLGAYNINAIAGSGSATVTITNITGGALSEALVLKYSIIKSVTA
jgi:hypothetical protein